MLRHLGHDAVAASNGQQALQWLESDGALNIALLDYVMPDMNGFEVAGAIRARRPTMAIIFVTGRMGVAALGAEGAPSFKNPIRLKCWMNK